MSWRPDTVARAAAIYRREAVPYGIDQGNRLPKGERNRIVEVIAAELGFSFNTVDRRLSNYGRNFDGSDSGFHAPAARTYSNTRQPGPVTSQPTLRVSQEQIIERERLAAARRDQDVTGRTFGDPPPGFSALDRRRSS